MANIKQILTFNTGPIVEKFVFKRWSVILGLRFDSLMDVWVILLEY